MTLRLLLVGVFSKLEYIHCCFVCCESVGWGVDQSVGGFGDEPGIKVQLMNLIRSVRTVMRGRFVSFSFSPLSL